MLDHPISFIFYLLLTIVVYQLFVLLQNKLKLIWLNPMMMSLFVLIPLLDHQGISYQTYYQDTKIFTQLLEPAIVALGFVLYKQLHTIKAHLKAITLVLTTSISLFIMVNMTFTLLILQRYDIAVSMSLKSVTTPIGLALTEQLHGIAAITAVSIIIAGIVGAIWGISLLNRFNITHPQAQGLAIGCASHALGTATISPLGYQYGAYSSLALVVSAVITALLSPLLIPMFQL
ncbi:LrgB family protein [Thalassotalea sp. LPB0316]|uniref:LrgB family protein n=1 Tax=Thalassotalea sp. LPB0316 TaxID=2769490 RepID=UPI001866BE4A|nr:LrgB family protein [Thalassotalea sp. LPB0316]QOL25366.1 LrgB family protein [Thalassotalea sp. LPB0316]